MTEKQLAEIRAAAREAATRSRAEQGLPEKITDPRVIAQVATLMRTPIKREEC
jgi:hypothetical protein